MTEKELEQKLVKAVKNRSGWAPKLISPGINGMPDRLVLMPGGRIGFVEVKAPGRKMRSNQIKRKSKLESLGFLVYCIDDPGMIDQTIDKITRGYD